MDILQCCGQTDKTETADYVRGESFSYSHGRAKFGMQGLEQGGHELFDAARCQSLLFHTLRGMIVGLHTHLPQHESIGTVNVRMTYIDTPVKDGRSPEQDIIGVQLYRPEDKLDTGKPDTIHPSVAIGKMTNQPCLTTLAYLLETGKLSLNLYERHIGCQL